MLLPSEIEILENSNEIELFNGESKVRIKIEHQLMQILVLLIESEGKLVEKDIFIDKVWNGNNFTGDGALTKNIFKLREIFKVNNIDNIIQIETIPKKGYRLLMNQDHVPINKRRFNYTKAILVVGSIFVLLAFFYFISNPNQSVNNSVQVISIDGKDTIIQPGNKRVQVINIDTISTRLSSLDSIKK